MRNPRAGLLVSTFVLALTGWACGSDGSSSPPEVVATAEPYSASTAPGESGGKKSDVGAKPKGDAEVELADDPAPEFEVETFAGGTFAIREQLGTPVVLNFWESW